jgi:hypothetical protein
VNRRHFDTMENAELRANIGEVTPRVPMPAPGSCAHEWQIWSVNRALIVCFRGCSIPVQRVESLSKFMGSTRTHEAPSALTSTWYVYVQRRFPFRKSYRSTGIQEYKYV